MDPIFYMETEQPFFFFFLLLDTAYANNSV